MSWFSKLFKRESLRESERPKPELPTFPPKSIAGVLITASGIKCKDGTSIPFSAMVEVKAPKYLIVADPNQVEGDMQTGPVDGGIVLISVGHGSPGHPPGQKVIRTPSRTEAEAIVSAIQEARKISKQRDHSTEWGRERPVVGKCQKCGKPLRVRSRAIKTEMHLTCVCGEKTIVNLSERDIQKIQKER
jgi:hypothetical protein